MIIDCNGVLVDSELLTNRGMCSVLQQPGVATTLEMVAECIGMKRDDILAHIALKTESTISPDTTADIWPAPRDLFVEELAPTPDVIPFLDRLPDRRCVACSSEKVRNRSAVRTHQACLDLPEGQAPQQLCRRTIEFCHRHLSIYALSPEGLPEEGSYISEQALECARQDCKAAMVIDLQRLSERQKPRRLAAKCIDHQVQLCAGSSARSIRRTRFPASTLRRLRAPHPCRTGGFHRFCTIAIGLALAIA